MRYLVYQKPLLISTLTVVYLFLLITCSGKKPDNSPAFADIKGDIVKIAERFSLVSTDSCTILTINDPWQGASGIRHIYYLINKGSSISPAVPAESIIYVPVRNVVCMSTTHIAMITALGERQSVTGVSGANYVFDGEILNLLRDGQIKDVGYEAGLNSELILKLSPEILISYGIGSESLGYTGKINELGIKTLFIADYLEENPLGKAEWIKLFGALYCRENLADSIFMSVTESYESIREYVENNTTERPKVMLGLPFRDTWYISPGNSYISRLIADAGGEYIWSSTESAVSMPYGLEDVFMASKDAEYWLNIGNAVSKKDISSVDIRLTGFSCYSNDNLYNNNKRISSGGGNDYWESGTIHPDIILRDIAIILHPGLFDDKELFYYMKLE